MKISNISTGFIEVPGQMTTNIYVQGCSIHCPGCHNPDLQRFDSGEYFDYDTLKNMVKELEITPWICWLGGEPTDQYKELIEFSKKFKEIGYSIALYTGRKFEEHSVEVKETFDLMKCGPYDGFNIDDPKSSQRFYIKNKCHKDSWRPLKYSELIEIPHCYGIY